MVRHVGRRGQSKEFAIHVHPYLQNTSVKVITSPTKVSVMAIKDVLGRRHFRDLMESDRWTKSVTYWSGKLHVALVGAFRYTTMRGRIGDLDPRS